MFVRAILHLHANRAVIPGVGQHREKTSPVHVAEPGQFRGMVFQRRGENAYLVQPIPVKAHILGMHMKKTVAKVRKGRR